MPNTNITADKVIGKNLYAKGNVDVYDYPNGKLINRFTNGYLIGNVYSYLINNGQVYWMFYDKENNPYYVKHVTGNLELKELPELIKQVEDEAIKKEIETKGALNYYLQKYLPWIVGAIVVSLVLPKIIKNKSNE
jgi:hypothetical protein